jgi:4-amino-4-deoxy-L-arabinose transferase-like glycosyltransferase
MIAYAISRIFLMTTVTLPPLAMALAWRREAPQMYDAVIAVVLCLWAIVVIVVVRRAVRAGKRYD